VKKAISLLRLHTFSLSRFPAFPLLHLPTLLQPIFLEHRQYMIECQNRMIKDNARPGKSHNFADLFFVWFLITVNCTVFTRDLALVMRTFSYSCFRIIQQFSAFITKSLGMMHFTAMQSDHCTYSLILSFQIFRSKSFSFFYSHQIITLSLPSGITTSFNVYFITHLSTFSNIIN